MTIDTVPMSSIPGGGPFLSGGEFWFKNNATTACKITDGTLVATWTGAEPVISFPNAHVVLE